MTFTPKEAVNSWNENFRVCLIAQRFKCRSLQLASAFILAGASAGSLPHAMLSAAPDPASRALHHPQISCLPTFLLSFALKVDLGQSG